jgi:tetratricopeptide (TPR) repeat protein
MLQEYAVRIFSILIIFVLSGCAGIGVVATSDPYKKLAQADAMMNQDRSAMAELLIGDALKVFVEKNDEAGIADAYNAYGNLYKHPSYHGKWKPTFEKLGTYDGTYQKSIDYFNKARDIFEKRNDVTGVSKSLLGIGNVYGIKNDREKSCQYYNKALDHYNSGKEQGLIKAEPVMNDRRYKNLGELIKAFITHYCDT